MRICVVTQYFWPESFRINDLVLALTERGHLVQIVTGLPNYPSGRVAPGYKAFRPKKSTYMGSPVTRVPVIPRGRGTGARLAANYISFAASASIFGPGAVERPVDVVLAYEPSPVTVGLPALRIGKQLKAPVLMWIQDLWPETLTATGAVRGKFSLGLADWITRRLHRQMDGLLVQSEAFVPTLESQGIDRSRIVYVPNWADEFFKPVQVPSTAPERLELPVGFVIMFAGNLGVAQGLEVLLDAAERLRDVSDLHWVVLGEGRRAAWLRSEVASRRLSNVHMLGSRPAESMPTWFALADALLVTLRADALYELTVPSKVQSYLACGRPILASIGSAGSALVEQSQAGLATPAGDADALAKAAMQLYRMPPAERSAMGDSGRYYYLQNFDRETLVRRIESVLQAAAGAHPVTDPV